MNALFGGALRGLRTHWRLAAALYAVHVAAAALFAWICFRSLYQLFGDRPLFREAMAGDIGALLLVLEARPGVLVPLVWAAVAIAVAYWVGSLFLGAGLIGALRGQPFGATALARAFAFFRLWLYALVPSGLALGLAGFVVMRLGLARGGAFGVSNDLVTVLAGAIPGLLVYGFLATAVDLARVLLVEDPTLGAGRAFLRGLRGAAGFPTLQMWLYGAAWLGVSVLYTRGTFDAGLGVGAMFVLRQVVVAIRFLLRFATTAGQVAWIEGTATARGSRSASARRTAEPAP
jgi:hypothetical protein